MSNTPCVKTVLILAANPTDTARLRLDQEVREIEEGLKRASKREQFRLVKKEAVRSRDFYRAMLDHQPHIVHFCGHGTGVDGIVLEDDTGQPTLIDQEALSTLFEVFAEQIECIVLNACYSQIQAEAISQYIKYVIGMNQSIGDKAAIAFAVAFYDALGAGHTVEFAFNLGCSQLVNLREDQKPGLISRAKDVTHTVRKAKAIFVITGTIKTVDKATLKAIEAHLQRISGDATLTFTDIEEGSIKITLQGSPEGLEQLKKLFESGELNEVLNITVQDVQLIANETSDNEEIIPVQNVQLIANETSDNEEIIPVQDVQLIANKTSDNKELIPVGKQKPKISQITLLPRKRKIYLSLVLGLLGTLLIFILDKFIPVHKLDPQSADAYNGRGIAYSDKKEYDSAIADYNQALKLDPNYAIAYYNRGIAYYNKKDYDRAIADYSQALKLNPSDADVYYGRGLAYLDKKDYDRAIADNSQALKLDPNYTSAYYNRGLAYSYKKDYDRAIADYNQALKLDPKSAAAYDNRCQAYGHKGDNDRAITDCDQAIKLRPNFSDAYYNRGLAYKNKGSKDKAVQDFKKVLELNNDVELSQKAKQELQQLGTK